MIGIIMTKRIEDSKQIKAFITTSEQYCRLIEERNKYNEIEILQNLYRLLPALSICTMNLPYILRFKQYRRFPDRDNSFSIWNAIYKSLNLQLKSHDSYLEIFDPYEKNSIPNNASLSDDIADIYISIAPGLKEWPNSDITLRRGIIWEWKFSYENHWGEHLIRSFRAIHNLLFSQITDKDGDYVGIKYIGSEHRPSSTEH
jgi:hypothetical protein